MGVIGRAADEVRLGLEVDAPLAEPAHDLLDLAHDLRTDAVAGEKEKLVRCHDRCPCSIFASSSPVSFRESISSSPPAALILRSRREAASRRRAEKPPGRRYDVDGRNMSGRDVRV